VNRVGATFVHRVAEMTGATPSEIVRAYLITREVFDFVPLWEEIESLNGKVEDRVQAETLIETGRTITRATSWFLRWPRLAEDMAATIASFRTGVDEVRTVLQRARYAGSPKGAAKKYATASVPESLAARVVGYDALFGALDITEIAATTGRPVATVTAVYFELSQRLGLGWLRERIGLLPADTHWQALARTSMRDDLAALARSLATRALTDGKGKDDVEALIGAWEARSAPSQKRAERMLAELRALPALDASMLAVALRELRNLA
jgi:glutamate dehydrogenase